MKCAVAGLGLTLSLAAAAMAQHVTPAGVTGPPGTMPTLHALPRA